jgi:hypothetical protein
MINKQVCQKCCEIPTAFPNPVFEGFENMWKKGEIACPNQLSVYYFRIFDDKSYSLPPQWCPKKFEHAVAVGVAGEDHA